MRSDAILSECGFYRYTLTREWDSNLLQVLFIMLNPSTADAKRDDQTIRKCTGFAQRWGYGGFSVVNLFALRSPDPSKLKRSTVDPVGPDNDGWILNLHLAASVTVCAWGPNGQYLGRDLEVIEMLQPSNKSLFCIKTGQYDIPLHPLMLPYSLMPKRLNTKVLV